MKLPSAGWICAVILLCLSTFGVFNCVRVILYTCLFMLGFASMIYLSLDDEDCNGHYTKTELLSNPLEKKSFITGPLKLKPLSSLVEKLSCENLEVTGHRQVDHFLHEILDVVVSDYVCIWYGVITADTEFIKTIKHLSHSVAVSVSNRVKSVDWLLHITGKAIEDMACHLRLFRSAGGSVTKTPFRHPRRGSPAHSPARAGFHRRNKSDTDVATISGVYMSNVKTANTLKNNACLEQKFFEVEFELENKKYSRESISIDDTKKNLILSEIAQIILFLTMENNELKCSVTSCILRSLVSSVFQLILNHVASPDTLNMLFLRMSCKDSLSTESFLTVLRTTDNLEELKATLALVQKEIHHLVSKDSGGECEITVKQQLSSLQYLTRLLTNRTSILTPNPNSAAPTILLAKLPLGFLLDNHLALCYFLDFAHSMSAHPYIFCHLSIEAWRANALKYLAEIDKKISDKSSSTKMIRSAALTIYDQYFSKDSRNRLDVPPQIIDVFISRINLPLNKNCLVWFEDIEKHIYSKLVLVEESFRNSNQYVRLLAELDLEDVTCENPKKIDHKRTGSMGNTTLGMSTNQIGSSLLPNDIPKHTVEAPKVVSLPKLVVKPFESTSQPATSDKITTITQDIPCRLEVHIVETGLMQERGRAYGVYSLEVKKWDSSGKQFSWHVYRRYSDFHELNITIKEAYPELSKMEFPSKKTFHNTSRNVLERRMVLLSTWISTLASLGSPGGPQRYAPLHLYLLPFLNPRGPQDKHPTGINSILVQPLRQGMRTLRNVPEQLANTVDDIMGGISKFIGTNKSSFPSTIPTLLHSETGFRKFDIEGLYESEELPLRVVLLLLDEVFELRCRNKWLRRQIVTIMRQILTTMFADVLNRKIIDVITSATSATSVASYLNNVKRSFFIVNNKSHEVRDVSAQSRTRVAAKSVLLSCRQEELKHLIGSQTTHRGLITVFELFQNQTLNTRLIFVLLEGLLRVMFQERDLSDAFEKMLHQSLRNDC